MQRGPIRPHRAILGTDQAAELHKDHGRHCKHARHGTANTDSVFFCLFHHVIRCEDLGQVSMRVGIFFYHCHFWTSAVPRYSTSAVRLLLW